jgi:hypothetical protein
MSNGNSAPDRRRCAEIGIATNAGHRVGQLKAHAMADMQVLEMGRNRRRGGALHGPCRLIDHRDLRAKLPRAGGHFQPDIAGADDGHMHARFQFRLQAWASSSVRSVKIASSGTPITGGSGRARAPVARTSVP